MNYHCRKLFSGSHNCQPGGNNNANNNGGSDQISFFLGEDIATTSTECLAGSLGLSTEQMPFSSSYAGNSSSSAEAMDGFRGVGGLGGVHQGNSSGGRGKNQIEQDLDSLDCDSEDGVGIFEEAVKQAPTRSYGSKRGRAAEVHNLSEKRRRSKINEKMKALQNLIPNSNKTDKASMLDEAIEYLKQLQLQVQMLSVRNGLSLHPMYLSGALHPLQSPEMCISLGLDADIAMNIGTGMLPVHHESAAAQGSSSVLNHSTSAHQHNTVMRSLANFTNAESSVMMESSQNHHGPPFRLPLSHEETLSNSMVSQQHLVAAQSKRNAIGNTMSSLPINNAQQFGGQASMLGEGCLLGRERPQDMPPDVSGRVQHLNG